MPTQNNMNQSDLERQAMALAEQLGRIAGTVEGTAESWLKQPSVIEQLTRVRDGAAQLLNTLTTGAEQGRQAAMTAARRVGLQPRQTLPKKKRTAGASAQATRPDPARAPGKRRRKPAPTMRGVKKSDEAIPKMRTAQAARQRRKSYA